MGLKINGIPVAGRGVPGAPGKSAYKYAQEVGYEDSEAKFSEHLYAATKAATREEVDQKISAHNASTETPAHTDIRLLITQLSNRLDGIANSSVEDLDTLAEIVSYIQSNKSLIDSITTSKVSVTDIVNDLTTDVSNKPLSAAQGVVLKNSLDKIPPIIVWDTSVSAEAPEVIDGAIMVKVTG